MPEETLLILLINLTYCQYISDIYRFFFPTIELSMEIFTLGITDIRYFNKIWVIFPNISNLSLKKKKKIQHVSCSYWSLISQINYLKINKS